MKPVKVGILGLGTVGGGTVNVLKRNAAEIAPDRVFASRNAIDCSFAFRLVEAPMGRRDAGSLGRGRPIE